MTLRRSFLAGFATLLATPALAASAFPLTVTDIQGHSVTLPRAPRRILLGDSMLFNALSLVDPAVDERIILIDRFMERYDQRYYASLCALYPKLGSIPQIDELNAASMERAIEAAPDLVILSLWQKGTTTGPAAQFASLGVPVVYVDTFLDPDGNLPRSMVLLGKLLDRPSAAEAFVRFRAERLARVEGAGLSAAPVSVMLQVYPGIMSCCWVPGTAGFGQGIPQAGGRNIGMAHVPSSFGGALSLEYVIAANPRFWVGTGLSNPGDKTGLTVGFGIDAATCRSSLTRMLARSDIASIPAVAAHRAYALWNFFNGSPFGFLAIEAMATWFHPDLAARAGIDPTASFDRLRQDFLHRDLTGTLWLAEQTA